MARSPGLTGEFEEGGPLEVQAASNQHENGEKLHVCERFREGGATLLCVARLLPSQCVSSMD